MSVDPATGRLLSDNAIQRVVFVSNDVHVYQIPPLTSNKGFTASAWTAPPRPIAQEIFVARLRVIETSVDSQITVVIVLEDPKTGDLFAAAPYTSDAIVQQATDSSRFFAIRVQGEGGMKATLGMGFEDRSPAFDFGIALSDARKILAAGQTAPTSGTGKAPSTQAAKDIKTDFSLKDGEKIHVQIGSNPAHAARPVPTQTNSLTDTAALFSIAPPPAGSSSSASQAAKDLGFDDGDFGDFQ